MVKTKKEVHWKDEHEDILADWADKAMCYRWLHSKSNEKYYILNIWFTIPVIIISTITGTANFAQDRFADSYKDIAVMFIGGLNIVAGIISTIQQFLKIAQLNESHRVSSIAWDKFYRNIRVELSKSRRERTPVIHLLKNSKEEFDRLMETSPSIKEDVINKFQKTFKNPKYKDICMPEICDNLESAKKIVLKKEEEEDNPEAEIERMIMEKRKEDIKKFNQMFLRVRGRLPIPEEIADHFGSSDIRMNMGGGLGTPFKEGDDDSEDEIELTGMSAAGGVSPLISPSTDGGGGEEEGDE